MHENQAMGATAELCFRVTRLLYLGLLYTARGVRAIWAEFAAPRQAAVLFDSTLFLTGAVFCMNPPWKFAFAYR